MRLLIVSTGMLHDTTVIYRYVCIWIRYSFPCGTHMGTSWLAVLKNVLKPNLFLSYCLTQLRVPRTVLDPCSVCVSCTRMRFRSRSTVQGLTLIDSNPQRNAAKGQQSQEGLQDLATEALTKHSIQTFTHVGIPKTGGVRIFTGVSLPPVEKASWRWVDPHASDSTSCCCSQPRALPHTLLAVCRYSWIVSWPGCKCAAHGILTQRLFKRIFSAKFLVCFLVPPFPEQMQLNQENGIHAWGEGKGGEGGGGGGGGWESSFQSLVSLQDCS